MENEGWRGFKGGYWRVRVRSKFVYLFIHLFLGERSQWKLIREGEEYEFRADRVFILR